MPDAPLPLWPTDPDTDPADVPTLTLYRSESAANGAAVMICPGGGYGHLADHEGHNVALHLNAQGFHAAVLRYRLGPRHRHPAMIHDAQRGLRLLRAHAADWNIQPDAIAVLGFSAGGHLASTLAVHFDRFAADEDDLAATRSARPDAAVLCYPVIDLAGAWAHPGSRRNLLGEEPDPAAVELLSNHRQVTAQTPPVFLWHTADDASVPVENSLCFAAACRAQRVPVELHVYESGRHGLGLAGDRPDLATWLDHCTAFLRRHLGREAGAVQQAQPEAAGGRAASAR